MPTEANKKFILVANTEKKDVVEVGRSLLNCLSQHGTVVAHNLNEPLKYDQLPTADFVVVVGGDGTLLSTIRKINQHQIPLIGVNMGKLGFLAEFSLEEIQQSLSQVIKDRSLISPRSILQCSISGENRDEHRALAANELAVIAGPPFRMLEVSITVAKEHLAHCRGDGLIVSTPTGSTAYNLSAGGPIMDASLDATVITPLAAHSLSFRPIVVNMDKVIELQVTNIRRDPSKAAENPKLAGPSAVVVIDGQEYFPLGRDDTIMISRFDHNFQIVRNPNHGQWQLLNTKLNWGSTPVYNHTNDRQDMVK